MDKIEAAKNKKLLEEDRARLLSLNHLNSQWAFRNECEKRIRQINKDLDGIRVGLKDEKY